MNKSRDPSPKICHFCDSSLICLQRGFPKTLIHGYPTTSRHVIQGIICNGMMLLHAV